MTTLDELFGPDALQAEIDAGYIRVGRSGDGLSIYNYTERAQYDHHWTPVTLRCRGLIARDDTGEILAWPFPKFFNHSEHGHGNPWAPDLPPADTPFTVSDKVDGSLGIVFWDPRRGIVQGARWRVASRGSFNSEQAKWAQRYIIMHDDTGLALTRRLEPGYTYLCEIVYPENRIVVNNGTREDLVLLAVYDENGYEDALEYNARHRHDWRGVGSIVADYRNVHRSVEQLVSMAAANKELVSGAVKTGTDMEGYVLRYATGLRVKIKLAEYVRLHAIITGMNERTIWEVLATGGALDDLLESVPDEFMRWVRGVAARLQAEHDAYVVAAHMAYANVFREGASRKEFALEATRTGYSGALFRLYDGKAIDELAWKSCRPSGEAKFVSDEEG